MPPPPSEDRTSIARLALGERELQALLDWARAAAPQEACGMLLGHRESDRVEVCDVRRARNIASEPTRAFELHPEDHLALTLEAERRGLEVVGVWHSHPRGPATPSATDRANAWSAWAQVIVGRDARGEFELRAWRVHGREWIELEIGD